MNAQEQAQQIRNKCQEVFAKAKQLWPELSFDKVAIRFDLKGRCAGIAGMRHGSYYLRFNADMLTREAFDHLLNDTVPHEIAHIVCFKNPMLGRNHNHGWARVCRLLGGSGNRCHNEDVVYGKGTTYEYTTDRGHKVRVSEAMHKKIQAGAVYTYRQGKGRTSASCAYSIVGHQGRTFAAPVVKKAVADPVQTVSTGLVQTKNTYTPNNPAAIEAWVREQMAKTRKLQVVDLTGDKPKTETITLPPLQLPPAAAPVQRAQPGESKAATSRRIMLSGYRAGHTYDQIINAMIAANGYDRQLARATFKANAAKVGIPSNWGG